MGQEIKEKPEGPRPSLPSPARVRAGDVAGCRDDVSKRTEEREMEMQGCLPFGSPSTAPHEPPAPMPADDPKCPHPTLLSSLHKDNLRLSNGEDQEEIPHSRDAGLEFQHIFVKELKKKK